MTPPRVRPWEPPLLLPPSGLVVLVDTETTGFPWERDTVSCIELSAVVVHVPAGKEVATFDTLVAPQYPLGEDDLRVMREINHVDPLDLLTAPPAQVVCHRFRRWLAHWAPDAPVTAYNWPFDQEILARIGLHLPVDTPCLQRLAQDVVLPPHRARLRLSRACSHFGVHVDGTAHRALVDARMAAQVLLALYCLGFRGEGPVNLTWTPMAPWFEDTQDVLPCPGHARTPALEALHRHAATLGIQVPPEWIGAPPAEALDLIPEAVWEEVYRQRVRFIPALAKALAHTRGRPLEGHVRARLWAQIRDQELEDEGG